MPFKIKPRMMAQSVRGFTLMEICATVGIIIILMVLLLPALRNAKDSSNGAVCASNLRQFSVGLVQYVNDHDGIMPGSYYATDPNGGKDISLNKNSKISDWMFDYLGNGMQPLKIALCPADKHPKAGTYMYYMDYIQNYNIFVAYLDGVPYPTAPAYGKPIRMGSVQNKILMADGVDSEEAKTWPVIGPQPLPDSYFGPGQNSLTYNFADRVLSIRHHGGSNCLFGDGSVRWLSKSDASAKALINRDDQLP